MLWRQLENGEKNFTGKIGDICDMLSQIVKKNSWQLMCQNIKSDS